MHPVPWRAHITIHKIQPGVRAEQGGPWRPHPLTAQLLMGRWDTGLSDQESQGTACLEARGQRAWRPGTAPGSQGTARLEARDSAWWGLGRLDGLQL